MNKSILYCSHTNDVSELISILQFSLHIKNRSGKSHLVQTVEDYLSCLGWIVTNAKFERSAEHTSRGILSSMFDKVISDLVKMKNKEGGNTNQSDVEYVQRVSKSILDRIGSDGLSRMVVFLPSIPLLFEDIGVRSRSISPLKEAGEKLIFGLSTILEAVLESDRFILICADDLQVILAASCLLQFAPNILDTSHLAFACITVGGSYIHQLHHRASHQFSKHQTHESAMPICWALPRGRSQVPKIISSKHEQPYKHI